MKRQFLSLNQFLYKCLDNNIDFTRVQFVREKKHSVWDHYFNEGIPVRFTRRGETSFSVSGTGSGWNCSVIESDCEILSVQLKRGGALVVLGEGIR